MTLAFERDSKFDPTLTFIVSWFSVRYAAVAVAVARREIFGINVLGGKLHQLGPPNLQDISSLGGKLLWEGNYSLILKNEMATAGISLKIIYIFNWLFLIGRRLNVFIGDMCNRYICPLQPFRHLTFEALNSRSSTECQSNPHSGL